MSPIDPHASQATIATLRARVAELEAALELEHEEVNRVRDIAFALQATNHALRAALGEARFYAVEYGSSKGVAAIDAALAQPARSEGMEAQRAAGVTPPDGEIGERPRRGFEAPLITHPSSAAIEGDEEAKKLVHRWTSANDVDWYESNGASLENIISTALRAAEAKGMERAAKQALTTRTNSGT